MRNTKKRAALNGAVFLIGLFFRRGVGEIVNEFGDILQLTLVEFFQIIDQLVELLGIVGGFIEEIPRRDVEVFADVKEGVHGWQTFSGFNIIYIVYI